MHGRPLAQLGGEPRLETAGGDGSLEFVFFPLIEYKQQAVPLKIVSAELGEFNFQLILSSKKNVKPCGSAFATA